MRDALFSRPIVRSVESGRPAVARLQALVRGVLARRKLEASPLGVVTLEPLLTAGGELRVVTTIELISRVRSIPQRPRKTPAQKEFPRKVVVVTAAFIVGVLALVVMRNPSGARMAAAGAAVTMMELLKARAGPRM